LVQIDSPHAASRLLEGVWAKPLRTKDIEWYDEATVELAMEGLVEIGDEAVEEIEDIYMERSFSEERFEKIVSVVGRISGKESFHLLVRLTSKAPSYALEDLAWETMRSMVEGDDELADYLPHFLVHANPVLREAAVSMLPSTGSEQAVDILIETLREDSSEDVRSEAAWALSRFGDSRSVEALLEALKDEESNEVRRRIIFVLGHIGSERAMEGLIQAEGEEFDLHHSLYGRIAHELVENGDKALKPLLDRILNEEGDAVQHEIADALVEIGDDSIVDPLIQGLQDSSKDIRVRRRIAYVLGEMGDERAIPALISGPQGGGASGPCAAQVVR
jgi:HEAT repeat protein